MDLGAVPAALRPLLPELHESLNTGLASVQQCLEAGEGAAEAAHALKGPCQLFQLNELAAAAARLEARILAGSDAGVQLREFAALLELLERSLG